MRAVLVVWTSILFLLDDVLCQNGGLLSFSEQPLDSVVPSGAAAKFRCSLVNDGSVGRITISWLKDGRPLHSSGRRVRFSPDGGTIYIKKAEKMVSLLFLTN